MSGKLSASVPSAVELKAMGTAKSMLLWPEQTNTSPKSTFWSLIVVVALPPPAPPSAPLEMVVGADAVALMLYGVEEGGICGNVAVKIWVPDPSGPGVISLATHVAVVVAVVAVVAVTHTSTPPSNMVLKPQTIECCGAACNTIPSEWVVEKRNP
jgi:hypothetical protein